MKKLLIIILFSTTIMVYGQFEYQCGMDENYHESFPKGYQLNPPQVGGKYAPAKTLNGSYMRIFIVFAQFEGDNNDPNDTNWQPGSLPIWWNIFLGTDVNQAPFSENTLSNYFFEMSNGQNIIIGYVYPELVIIPGGISSNYGQKNHEVLQAVDPFVNFQNFDNWNFPGEYLQYFNQTDGHVDAVYIVWRNLATSWGGIGQLGTNYTTNDGVVIDNRIKTISMTVKIGGNHNYTFPNKIGLLAHEYGHYLYGANHDFENNYYSGMPDGTIERGLGLMNANSGGGLSMNPEEKYLLGYTTYSDIFYDQSGTLPDFITTGASYRFPIPTFINGEPNADPSEFIVIANHQAISVYDIKEHPGIYVYHVKNKNYGMNQIDMITADGLWQCQVLDWVPRPNGYGSPPNWYRYHGNNPPALFPCIARNIVDRVNGRDQLQEVVYAQYPGENYYWWDRWLDESCVTNNKVVPEHSLPWSMGYNQLFSPWSNPPTYDKNRTPVYTTMQILNNNNGSFNLQFFVGENECLLAPPAKPQNLQVGPDGNYHPLLTWEANIEPDINNYKVYKYVTNWQYMGTSAHHNYYTDQTETYCTPNPPCYSFHDVWYRVTAIDNQALESVPSDSVIAVVTGGGIQKRIAERDQAIPSEYLLKTNYPNPYNPTTTINYQLPIKGFVMLKIYDILGREVATLVNEQKDPGSYSVNFDASRLASGVYIYQIRANDYVNSKKMLLLK